MNYRVDRLINERTMGYFPVSIGTAFALQSTLGYAVELADSTKGPLVPSVSPPYLSYDCILINVRTIIRNFVNSMDAKQISLVKGEDIVNSVAGEMNYCLQIIKSQTQGKLNCVFYDVDYSGLERKFPNALYKEATTDKQIHYRDLETQCIRELRESNLPFDYRHYRREITDEFKRTLLLSHVPLDLLSMYNFSLLALLESHTGKIKLRNTWYSKLHAGIKDELINIPFGKFSLQVFGDGILFAAKPISVRKHVLEIAQKGKWIYSTTEEKIRSDINRYTSDPLLVNELTQLL